VYAKKQIMKCINKQLNHSGAAAEGDDGEQAPPPGRAAAAACQAAFRAPP
jgi:hypothetical protein